MPNPKQYLGEEVPLSEVKLRIDQLGAHGGMDGITAILRVARDQIERRPTGEVLWGVALVLLFCLGATLLFYEAFEHHLSLQLSLEIGAFLVALVAGYFLTSYRLDLQDRRSNEDIREEARTAILLALDASPVEAKPLQKELYDLLKRLAQGHPDFKSKVKPILTLGPLAKEWFPVDESP